MGNDVDIWELRSNKIGTDNINSLEELNKFQQICTKAIDEIGHAYGKDKQINVFPIMCNSLAIKFGQSIYHKSHNKIIIYDTVMSKKEQVVEKPVLKL